MKILNKLIAISLFLILVNSNNAYAENIAILDIENVLKNSLVMKNIEKKISKKSSEYQVVIDEKQSALSQEEKKLISKQSVMSKESFQSEKVKFENKLRELSAFVSQKQKTLDKASLGKG
ncbi:MAG: OmpH family outer membrane protein [Proteobacteria bacterium]|nr:OmpH family outer membrane protein [Pseudomonadota bacterium]